jgi:hypothetical protein
MSTHFLKTLALSASLVLGFGLLVGCGNAGPATTVQGKVTVNGQPVNGTIHFVAADGKEASGPIGPTGGTYTVSDPPLGEVTVLFKGGPAAAAAPLTPPKPLEGGPAPTMPGDTMKSTGAMGVAPPAKYSEAANGIKYTVTAGHNQKDFELTP